MHGVPPADLVETHLWIVEHFCARYRQQAPHADLHAAGALGLVEAAARFQPERGRKFSTYAWNWVKGYILSELRRSHVVPVPEHDARRALAAGTPVRGIVVFGSADPPSDHHQERTADESMRLRALGGLIRELACPLQRKVVRRALAGESVAQIASDLSLTQPRVVELLEEAGQELREMMT